MIVSFGADLIGVWDGEEKTCLHCGDDAQDIPVESHDELFIRRNADNTRYRRVVLPDLLEDDSIKCSLAAESCRGEINSMMN